MPIVTTLHTVLREPSPSQKAVMDEVLRLSERVVVMSQKAVGFLADIHGLPPDKVDLIPHGIPDIQASAGREFRATLGIDGPMILTFGLLSPDKGVQYVIEAMPSIVRQYPGAAYFVVGATHPQVRSSAGETYRESLVGLTQKLGVSANVRFVDRFVSTDELVEYLAAMDFYVTPYLNPRQITSGTLAYAIGAGKAVISTPYWYAEELLADGRGVLVPFRDSDAIARTILALQRKHALRQEMGRRAAEFGRKMLWPEVGRQYLASFTRGIAARSARSLAVCERPSARRASVEVS
jgi:glycosyltransferase involved in cell wall biosynthesis